VCVRACVRLRESQSEGEPFWFCTMARIDLISSGDSWAGDSDNTYIHTLSHTLTHTNTNTHIMCVYIHIYPCT
jgi:hypothetical protein